MRETPASRVGECPPLQQSWAETIQGDPVLIWDELLEAHRRAHGGEDCAAYWDHPSRVRHYDEMARRWQGDRISWMLDLLPLQARSRVLDIGSGPGTLAIPMAAQGAHVTAVDASEAMLAALGQRASEFGLDHIDTVPKRWEEVDPASDLEAPYDVVLASLCFGMWDIRRALEKMVEVCCGRVFLVWFAGQASWERLDRLIRRVVGREPGVALPKADLLLRVLRDMGISPEIVPFTYHQVDAYPSEDDALDAYCTRIRGDSPETRTAIRGILKPYLERSNGETIIRGQAPCACIWWDVREENVLHAMPVWGG